MGCLLFWRERVDFKNESFILVSVMFRGCAMAMFIESESNGLMKFHSKINVL